MTKNTIFLYGVISLKKRIVMYLTDITYKLYNGDDYYDKTAEGGI